MARFGHGDYFLSKLILLKVNIMLQGGDIASIAQLVKL